MKEGNDTKVFIIHMWTSSSVNT